MRTRVSDLTSDKALDRLEIQSLRTPTSPRHRTRPFAFGSRLVVFFLLVAIPIALGAHSPIHAQDLGSRADQGLVKPLSAERSSRVLSNLFTNLTRDQSLRATLADFLIDYSSRMEIRPPSNPHSDELSSIIEYRLDTFLASRGETRFLKRITNGKHEWRGLFEKGRSLSLQTELETGTRSATVRYDRKIYDEATSQLERLFPTLGNRFPLTTDKTTFLVEGIVETDDRPLVRVRVDHDSPDGNQGYGLLWVEENSDTTIHRIEVFASGNELIEDFSFDKYELVGSIVRLPMESAYRVHSVSWRGRNYVAFHERRTVSEISLGDPPVSRHRLRLLVPADVTVKVIPTEGVDAPDESELKPDAPPLAPGVWIGQGPESLEALRGQVVMLEFLSRFAAPTEREKATTKRVRKAAFESGVTILGVHPPDDDLTSVRAYLKKEGIEFPVLVDIEDPSRFGRGSTFAVYDVWRTPDRFLIDENGKFITGGPDVDEKALRDAVE